MSVRRSVPNESDIKWMARAVELARNCETEPDRALPSPKVGAVAVSAGGRLLGEAYRGSVRPGDHAEYCLIAQLGPEQGHLRGATVFTTLEPCTTRTPPKVACADRLIAEGVAVVYIGMLDPDPRIREVGWRKLGDAGIERRDFTEGLRDELSRLNQPFLDRFRVATGPRGTHTWDYTQNDGAMRIEHEGTSFETKWSPANSGVINAYSQPGGIALARAARDFNEIDDPGVYEFAGHSKRVLEGQIVIFRNASGYALVRVDRVIDRDRGDTHTEATASYELRLY